MVRSRDDDSSSVLTIQLDGKVDGKKSKRSVDSSTSSDLSEAKLQQLADAREKSIQSRRMTMRTKLERKLEELNLLMGDLRSDQVERVGQAMMDLETKLRQKHKKRLYTGVESANQRNERRDARAEERAAAPWPVGVCGIKFSCVTQSLTQAAGGFFHTPYSSFPS